MYMDIDGPKKMMLFEHEAAGNSTIMRGNSGCNSIKQSTTYEADG